jgi:uncharacterized cupin superfamily protein
MTQCIVVNITSRDDWTDQYFTDPTGKRALGLHMPNDVRPRVIHQTRQDAEKEAARLSCTTGNFGSDYAVFELVGIVSGQILVDTDHVKGIGACGAMMPRWLERFEI